MAHRSLESSILEILEMASDSSSDDDDDTGSTTGVGVMFHHLHTTVGIGAPPPGQGFGFLRPTLSYAPPQAVGIGAPPPGQGFGFLRPTLSYAPPQAARQAAQPLGSRAMQQLRELKLGTAPERRKAPGKPSDASVPSRRMPKVMSKEFFESLLRKENYMYRINMNGYRGRCIIYVNTDFPKPSERREGADVDVKKLKSLFEHLRYHVIVWEQLTKDQLKHEIDGEMRQEKFYKSSDSFIFVGMSHGREGLISDCNAKPINIEHDIRARFDGNNCPVLIGKPKIFIFQACQIDGYGPGITEGVPLGTDSSSAAPLETDAWSAAPLVTHIHEKLDTFTMTSTVPGYVALRDPVNGSWFISALCKTIIKYCHEESIGDIAIRVRHKMHTEQTGTKQLMEDNVRLSKKFYLPYFGDHRPY